MTTLSIRSRFLLRRVAFTGFLLGVVSGFMCGLTRSPIAALAIPSVLGIAVAAVGIGAERQSIFRLRWIYFSDFAMAFVVAFAISLAVGMTLNALQTKAPEQFVVFLKKLGLTDREIADKLATMVATSPEAIRHFDASWALYNANRSADAGSRTTVVNAETCDELRPPAVGYKDITWLKRFTDAGKPFSKIAAYIKRVQPKSESLQLLMLASGHYGVCGP